MIDKFLNIIDALASYKVEYILIGGFAINLYGLKRGTQDIDIFVKPEDDNIKRLRDALRSLYDDKSIEEISLQELNKYAVIRYGTPDNFYIDIITHIGEIFSFSDLKFQILDLDNHKINIATEKTLLKLKSHSYREIDASDVRFLKEIIKRKNDAGL